MHWERVKELSQEEFRRLTGIKRATFDEMIQIIKSKAFRPASRKALVKSDATENPIYSGNKNRTPKTQIEFF